ncbi:MAG: Hsp70 family protein, partial [Clostridium sp.]|uniref:Hsp70 family protein n=1 Tax=Clostridium sp. TaxID=1506 RepID=UPI003EE48063
MAYIGIDLGTTTSEIAVFRDEQVEVIKNIEEGESYVVPSIVLIDGENIIVGDKAKNQMILKADKIVSEVKRFMGQDVKLKINEQIYTPVQISSMILKKMKDIAEFYLGEEISEAVITVPANFNNKGRRDTKEAGRLAGLKVKRIINEPTAAALAYGLDKENSDLKVLVFDFGGGTLDISILEMVNRVIDVKISRGKNIGGKDIDKLLMRYIIERVEKETNKEINTKNLRSISMLKKASEECKKNLAFYKEWDVVIPGIDKDENGELIDVDCVIKREEFDFLIKEIIKEGEALIDEALNGALIKAKDIDKIVLVGGSTRIVAIREMFKRKFGEE